MAFDFKKLNFFSRLDARARVFVLFGGIVGVLVLVYFLTVWISGSSTTTGPSRVAAAPQGLQSVPGGQLTPAYYQALMQANKQAAQQAQISGGSAVPTLINTGGQMTNSGNCTVLCMDQSANIKALMDDWVRQGKLSPDVAAQLQALADKNVSVEDFAAALDQLVKAGKLTPEQARQLLEAYKKQFGNAQLKDSAKIMDGLIQAGSLPIDIANALLEAQRNKVSPADYAALLQKYVREGRLSAAVAQQLLAQYTQQRAKEIVAQSLAVLHQMTLSGEITPEIEKGVSDLENQLVPVDAFTTAMQNYLNQNKITPAVATKIIDEYKWQKSQIGSSDSIDKMVQAAIDAAYLEIKQLLQSGAITQDTADQLTNMIAQNVSLETFQNTLSAMVQQKKLTPDIAKLKLADYLRIIQARALAQRLLDMQANNATAADYADALRAGVQQGILTPEQAAQLMRDYQALHAPVAAPASGGTSAFSQLQQRVQQGAPEAQAVASASQFNVPPAPPPQIQAAETSPDRQARLAAMQTAMGNQATQLVTSWGPPAMLHKEAPPNSGSGTGAAGNGTATGPGTGVPGSTTTTPAGPVIIKAGTILFAVLETTANSDYPDAPVMATVVDGQYKGAKLMGKLQTSKNAAGQLDRIVLNFTMMNTPDWPSTKTVTAYAVDPDTAKTALATDVNNHYLQKYGALLGASFIQGYATAITTSGSSQVNGALGTTTTTHPTLSNKDQFYVGLGQAGQTFAGFLQNWVNIPPTVKVQAGVGLGILFMSDVS